jgi:phosphoribosylamine-glycine ligase
LPILFREPLTSEEEDRLHHGEVALDGERLVTTGPLGYVTVATGIGPDIVTARTQAYALAHKVCVPRMRYRTDIGERLMQHDHEVLARWGHF